MSCPPNLLTSRFGDGLAVGPDLVAAAESAVTQALAPMRGQRPDLLCLFVCGDDPAMVESAATRAMEVAGARTTLGCGAGGVIGAGRGVENEPAVSVFAACLPGVRCTPLHLELVRIPEGVAVTGMPDRRDDDAVAVLLADPFTFPVTDFVQRSHDDLGGLPLIGGVASGPHGGESARLFLDGHSVRGGAVGVVLGGPVTARPVVSQGCRPFGPPMTVTRAEGNVLLELAGTPALAKLEQIVAGLPAEERSAAVRGLQIGVAMDEYAEEHERGGFLIRGIVGADQQRGAIAIADVVEVGRTVRFQVRDASTADQDLEELFTRFRAEAPPVGGALLFSCNGRGRAMFPSADHDVLAVRAGLDTTGVAGFFAAGEIGPVGGRNHLHGFTASILVFGADGS
ncbi:MAG: FIST C-terminal domain-containing protein [Pseudonocardiales bacterium]|nr:FIST C-terminal domain-containing protein [Pseudonocardiales bacterium]MBV9031148.1 FIST C-terminal domain-containing protein [Pseudonocardiales bacterium]MBW0010099.1 FIST C-terminal domain-containing protein [Pseudonocardiales bacterium]